MGNLPVKPGISPASVTDVPEKWSATWFRRFIKNHLQFADVRNASQGSGIAISGTPTNFATLAASGALASIPNDEVLGNISGSPAPPVGLTQAQLTALINAFNATLSGAVPASGGGTSLFLRADGTWASPGGGGLVSRGATWSSINGPILAGAMLPVSVIIPFNCTIRDVTVLTSGGTGSCQLDIWKTPYASYPPTVANSIVASAPPKISGGIKYQDTTLSGWTTSCAQFDTMIFFLASSSVFTEINIFLTLS